MAKDRTESRDSTYGWGSDFPTFRGTAARAIRGKLQDFIRDASPEQVHAWDESIPKLQNEVGEVLAVDPVADEYTAILEYELPMEARRPDAVFLVGAGVVVVELKGKDKASRADIDQAAAYVRDLRCYHAQCHEREVVGVLVPTLASGRLGVFSGVNVCGPDALDGLLKEVAASTRGEAVDAEKFLSIDAYSPLPSLVEAARELFHRRQLRSIWRGGEATDRAVAVISQVIHEAAATRSRRLVVLTGLPGSGKTLVGLRLVHAHFLDDLAVSAAGKKPTAPAVFLSGNGPLVAVLQHELKKADGEGKIFVRGVKDYVKRYSRKTDSSPPEHVLVFDEAQRAFDAAQVDAKHSNGTGKSEPQLFVEFAERVREWCVVVALVGGGQEIGIGEEGGLVQWRQALDASSSNSWHAHVSPEAKTVFAGSSKPFVVHDELHLKAEMRFHSAKNLHEFVAGLLLARRPDQLSPLARELAGASYHLRITRDLDEAKTYLRDRYQEDKQARFGLLASARDRDLHQFGIENGFNATNRMSFGSWYSDDEGSASSCRRLKACVTEFGAQGLELDASLLAWGTDLVWSGTAWSSANARQYREAHRVKDPHQLRVNAYRVLLTRARDVAVVFVPLLPELDLTYARLVESGFDPLSPA